MSISRRSARRGSSSTTMAMLAIASRNRDGMSASASAMSRSKLARSTSGLPRLTLALERLEVIAVVAHDALVAERLRPADSAAVQDERVRGARPPARRQRRAELLFDLLGRVGFSDADTVRD